MPELKTYDLFVSHAWQHNAHYYKLLNMLQKANNFKFRNYSVPEHDPLIQPGTIVGNNKLIDLINAQIKPVNCVVILGGMYTIHSEWISVEIELAQSFNKPIIGVYPWGHKIIPVAIKESAHALVKWNTSSIISAIRQVAI